MKKTAPLFPLYILYECVWERDNMEKLRVNLCDMDLVGLFGEKIS